MTAVDSFRIKITMESFEIWRISQLFVFFWSLFFSISIFLNFQVFWNFETDDVTRNSQLATRRSWLRRRKPSVLHFAPGIDVWSALQQRLVAGENLWGACPNWFMMAAYVEKPSTCYQVGLCCSLLQEWLLQAVTADLMFWMLADEQPLDSSSDQKRAPGVKPRSHRLFVPLVIATKGQRYRDIQVPI